MELLTLLVSLLIVSAVVFAYQVVCYYKYHAPVVKPSPHVGSRVLLQH
jgi:hypothetical protein